MLAMKMTSSGFEVFKHILNEVKAHAPRCTIRGQGLHGVVKSGNHFFVNLEQCGIQEQNQDLHFPIDDHTCQQIQNLGNAGPFVHFFANGTGLGSVIVQDRDSTAKLALRQDSEHVQTIHETAFNDEQNGYKLIDAEFVRQFGTLMKPSTEDQARITLFVKNQNDGCFQVLGFDNIFGFIGFDEESTSFLHGNHCDFTVTSYTVGMIDYIKLEVYIRKQKMDTTRPKEQDYFLFSKQYITPGIYFHFMEKIAHDATKNNFIPRGVQGINVESWLVHK